LFDPTFLLRSVKKFKISWVKHNLTIPLYYLSLPWSLIGFKKSISLKSKQSTSIILDVVWWMGVDSFCVLRPLEVEKESHLFGVCAFASALWRKLFNWFGWNGLVPRDLRHIFEKFNVGRGNGKRLNGLLVVWHAVVWAIWKTRNDLIFHEKVPVLEDVFQGIILHSWKWLCVKKMGVGCSFYEWITCPKDCILR
jgi:hypothetical protein